MPAAARRGMLNGLPMVLRRPAAAGALAFFGVSVLRRPAAAGALAFLAFRTGWRCLEVGLGVQARPRRLKGVYAALKGAKSVGELLLVLPRLLVEVGRAGCVHASL